MSKIVISYRQNDAPGTVGCIYERLCKRYGKERVYRDIDKLVPGEDFRRSLGTALSLCNVVIAVIGPRWYYADGKRRLDDPNDWVRLELETALLLNKIIIPVLVEEAKMPSKMDLPTNLKDIATLQAQRIDPLHNFVHDLDELSRTIEKYVPSEHEVAKALTWTGVGAGLGAVAEWLYTSIFD